MTGGESPQEGESSSAGFSTTSPTLSLCPGRISVHLHGVDRETGKPQPWEMGRLYRRLTACLWHPGPGSLFFVPILGLALNEQSFGKAIMMSHVPRGKLEILYTG